MTHTRHYDRLTVIVALLFFLLLSFVLYQDISAKQWLVFVIGSAIGISLVHAGFGFTGAWRDFILNRQSFGIRAQIILFILASVIMFPLVGGLLDTSVSYSAALAPVSLSVLFGSFLFGTGMQLGGGCGSGTLSTTGQGQLDMLITLVFFIIGSYVGTQHLGWWISFANLGEFSSINTLGWAPALLFQIIVLTGLYFIIYKMDLRHNTTIKKLSVQRTTTQQALIFGQWPILWGSILIALLAATTLLVTGHTWSITFAFGLWGAKLWQALGGHPELTQYWSSGYPYRALNSSVLADITSVMNFGILTGAAIAAALANKFSPLGVINYQRLFSAIIGGLLLGYGARLAFGCNIGALLGGITTGSAHAWVWLLGGFAGNIFGVRLRLRMSSHQD